LINDSYENTNYQAKQSFLSPRGIAHSYCVDQSGSGKSFVAPKRMLENIVKTRQNFKRILVRLKYLLCDYSRKTRSYMLFFKLFGYVKGAFKGAIED